MFRLTCQKPININPRVTTYCCLHEGHTGDCEPTLEEWELDLAIKIFNKRGFILISKPAQTLYVAKESKQSAKET
jgi:hypothetical protein